MSKQYDSEGFMSTPLEGSGARPKDNYHPDSEDNEVRFREADEEYQRLKADFARIARARRLNSHSRSDSSRSSSPLGRQPQKRATNLPKFRTVCLKPSTRRRRRKFEFCWWDWAESLVGRCDPHNGTPGKGPSRHKPTRHEGCARLHENKELVKDMFWEVSLYLQTGECFIIKINSMYYFKCSIDLNKFIYMS